MYFPRFVDAVYRRKGSGLALNADAFQQDPYRHASLFGSTTARQFSWLALFASPQVLLALVAVFREKVAHHDTRRKRPTAARRRNHVARTWRGGCTSSLFREVRAITTVPPRKGIARTIVLPKCMIVQTLPSRPCLAASLPRRARGWERRRPTTILARVVACSIPVRRPLS